MRTEPLKSVLTGYGLAGAAGLGLGLAAAAPVAGVLTFWLGGAALTLGVAALRAQQGDATADASAREREEAEYQASVARWERERRGIEPARKTG